MVLLILILDCNIMALGFIFYIDVICFMPECLVEIILYP